MGRADVHRVVLARDVRGLMLEPGAVVAIPYRGVRHEGLVTVAGDHDSARIVHSSKRVGRVVEEDARTFRAGRPLRVIGRAPHPPASIAYARACADARRVWTYADNCQTFTREVSGLTIPSPDAHRAGWTLAGLLGLAALVLRRSRHR